jgi:hypothetical protein
MDKTKNIQNIYPLSRMQEGVLDIFRFVHVFLPLGLVEAE